MILPLSRLPGKIFVAAQEALAFGTNSGFASMQESRVPIRKNEKFSQSKHGFD